MVSSIGQNSNIAFSGKIKVVSDFYDAMPALERVDWVKSWNVDEGKYAPKAYSDSASVCLIGSIRNAETSYMYHSIPVERRNSAEKIKSAIGSAVEFLHKNSGAEKLTGFLAGAKLCSKSSMKQAELFMKIYDEFNIQYSAFLGLKGDGGTNVYDSIPDETTVINPFSKPLRVIKDLGEMYEIFKKSDNDDICY